MILAGSGTSGIRTPVLEVKRLDFHTGRSLVLGFNLTAPFRGLSEEDVNSALLYGASNGGDEVLTATEAPLLESKDA